MLLLTQCKPKIDITLPLKNFGIHKNWVLERGGGNIAAYAYACDRGTEKGA